MSKVQKFLPLVLTFGLLASGCGGMNVASDYSLRQEISNGLILGSVTFKTSIHDDYFGNYAGDFRTHAVLVYRKIGSSELKYIDANTPNKFQPFDVGWSGNLYLEGIKGKMFVIELSAGAYEFIDTIIAVENAHPLTSEKHEFSVPFTVEAGKAVYLGDISCSVVANRCPMGTFPVERLSVR